MPTLGQQYFYLDGVSGVLNVMLNVLDAVIFIVLVWFISVKTLIYILVVRLFSLWKA